MVRLQILSRCDVPIMPGLYCGRPWRLSRARGCSRSPIANAAAAVPITDVWIDPALGAPGSLFARALSRRAIKLKWVYHSAGETGVKILQSRDGLGFSQIAAVGPGVTTYANTGLRPGTTYYYKVKAYDGGGNSADSNLASAETLPRR